MFILKGVLLGIGMFVVGLVAYIIGMTNFLTQGDPPHPGTIGIDLVSIIQHSYSWFLLGLLGCIALGISIIALWPTRVLAP